MRGYMAPQIKPKESFQNIERPVNNATTPAKVLMAAMDAPPMPINYISRRPCDWHVVSIDNDRILATWQTERFEGTMREFNEFLRS